MAAEVLKSFGTLQTELEQAKSSLKGVDENIKRLIGRDPSEVTNRGVKRQNPSNEDVRRQRQNQNNQQQNFNRARISFENDDGMTAGPAAKRRSVDSSVFKRLSDRPVGRYHDNDSYNEPPQQNKQLVSRVFVTPKEILSRQEVLAAQSADEKSKARNRRMFGALLGTLQKFRQEETKLKPKEEKRAQVEKKLEEQEIREKEEMKKERQDLFLNRKKKQAEIRMIELKMNRMKEHAAWEERQLPRSNFIITKAKPQIYYLPKVLNDTTRELLENCKKDIDKIITKKRQEVHDELEQIEGRMREKFENQKRNSNAQDEREDASDGEANYSGNNVIDQNIDNIEMKHETEEESLETTETLVEETITENMQTDNDNIINVKDDNVKTVPNDAEKEIEEENTLQEIAGKEIDLPPQEGDAADDSNEVNAKISS